MGFAKNEHVLFVSFFSQTFSLLNKRGTQAHVWGTQALKDHHPNPNHTSNASLGVCQIISVCMQYKFDDISNDIYRVLKLFVNFF
jgi:hypothetical protein